MAHDLSSMQKTAHTLGGTEEILTWHRLCLQALEAAVAAVRPGVTGRELFMLTCELFESEGFPTQRTKIEGETLEEGFFHSLGHGVGLEAHEAPLLGFLGQDPLVEGDVIAIASPSLSTNSSNELSLAFVASDSTSSPNTTVSGITGGGLTWTLVQRTNAQSGTAEIWRAFATTQLTGVSVTASLSQPVPGLQLQS